MTVSSVPLNTASAITPYNPLGKQTVGEEGKDSKNSTLKAVEEAAKSARSGVNAESDENQDNAVIESVLEKNQQQSSSQQDPSQKDPSLKDSQTDGNVNYGAQQNEIEQKKAREEKRQQTQEQDEVRQLASRDREVRNHERAHALVGGEYAGSPSYQYKKGPDGVSYAVSGEVSISTGSLSNDPQATISKAQKIRNAALAPADPSPQDLRVAANATRLELEARRELNLQRSEKLAEKAATVDSQKTEESKNDAPALEKGFSKNDLDDRTLQDTNKIDAETNRRILSLNTDYLSLSSDMPSRGSIVSEAV